MRHTSRELLLINTQSSVCLAVVSCRLHLNYLIIVFFRDFCANWCRITNYDQLACIRQIIEKRSRHRSRRWSNRLSIGFPFGIRYDQAKRNADVFMWFMWRYSIDSCIQFFSSVGMCTLRHRIWKLISKFVIAFRLNASKQCCLTNWVGCLCRLVCVWACILNAWCVCITLYSWDRFGFAMSHKITH